MLAAKKEVKIGQKSLLKINSFQVMVSHPPTVVVDNPMVVAGNLMEEANPMVEETNTEEETNTVEEEAHRLEGLEEVCHLVEAAGENFPAVESEWAGYLLEEVLAKKKKLERECRDWLWGFILKYRLFMTS
jgi:hypothetical protein